MSIAPDFGRHVWERFAADPQAAIERTRRDAVPPWNLGDQRWLELNIERADYWQDVLPGQLVSYKVHCRDGLPPGLAWSSSTAIRIRRGRRRGSRALARWAKRRAAPTGRLDEDRRRPTLPGPCGPSTIGAEGLNFSVRNGKRCFPLAIATENGERPRSGLCGPRRLARRALKTAQMAADRAIRFFPREENIRQALDPLVPVS